MNKQMVAEHAALYRFWLAWEAMNNTPEAADMAPGVLKLQAAEVEVRLALALGNPSPPAS